VWNEDYSKRKNRHDEVERGEGGKTDDSQQTSLYIQLVKKERKF
jgi:hypothetical protein